jgi:hypothetical protein
MRRGDFQASAPALLLAALLVGAPVLDVAAAVRVNLGPPPIAAAAPHQSAACLRCLEGLPASISAGPLGSVRPMEAGTGRTP